MFHINFFLFIQFHFLLDEKVRVQLILCSHADDIHLILVQELKEPVQLVGDRGLLTEIVHDLLVFQYIFLFLGFLQKSCQFLLKHVRPFHNLVHPSYEMLSIQGDVQLL